MSRSFRSRLTGVFGYPVDENPTIVMQEAAFVAAGIDWRYLTLMVKPEALAAAVEGMRAMNFDGVNLTIPHKTAIIPLLDEITESAKLIGAVNTVYREGDKLIGTNTDGKGFVEGLNQRGIKLKNQHLVILGAGGAARAIAVESALAGCASITIINRNQARGESLRDLINQKTEAQADYVEWVPEVRIPACDILINATNVGLYPDESCPDIRLDDISSGMIVQDIIPNPAITPFLKEAEKRGATVFDGLAMLVYQGAIAFELWTGVEPSTDVMKQALEEAFK